MAVDPVKFEDALEALVRAATAQPVAAGLAVIEVREESSPSGPVRVISVAPSRASACRMTVVAQSDREVSFFVGPRENPESMTVDLYDPDRGSLLEGVRAYLDAVLAGRVEIATRAEGSAAGRVVFVLADGERMDHSYNTFRRRRQSWNLHRFEAY